MGKIIYVTTLIWTVSFGIVGLTFLGLIISTAIRGIKAEKEGK